MAMVCALSCAVGRLSLAAVASSTSSSIAVRSCFFLSGTRLGERAVQLSRIKCLEKRNVVVNATLAEGSGTSEAVVEPLLASGGAAPVESPVNPIAALQLQSDLLRKKAKKLLKRRKRLVQKRHLRKKGRWPPSKMKKNQNV